MLIFIDWEGRPAVMNSDNHDSFAVLERGGSWVEVNSTDVGMNGIPMSEQAWRAAFEPHYGPLDLRRITLDPLK